MLRQVRKVSLQGILTKLISLPKSCSKHKANKPGWLLPWLTDLWYMGVLFCFFVPDEVEDEDKGKESEGGDAGGGWESDDTVKTFSILNSCDNIAQCL